MALEEDIVLQIQAFLGKTFGIQAYNITLGSVIDAAIAFPLLAFVFYTFFGRIRPFKSASNSVYAVISTALVGALVLYGGIIFVAGKFIAFASIVLAAWLADWERRKKIRFALTGLLVLALFYTFFGNLQSGVNLLRPAIAVLAIVNIFFSDMPLSAKIFLTIVVLAFVVVFWSQILALMNTAGMSSIG